jgi:hypothetical protein
MVQMVVDNQWLQQHPKLTDILIPKVENFDKMVQMVVDNQWLQWHPKLMRKFVIKDVGSNGST